MMNGKLLLYYIDEQLFSSLSLSSHDPALTAFSLGYLALFKEQTSDAIHHFQEGIAVCSNNALNNDIKRVIAQVEHAAASSPLGASTMNVSEPPQANSLNQAKVESTNVPTEQKQLTGFLGAYLDTIDDENGPH